MDYKSINTQWYTLEDDDKCEVDLTSGYVTLRDKNLNTKGLRMDRDILISSIIEGLSDLQIMREHENAEDKYNLSILECFKDAIESFIKTSETNKKNWEK
tara:strand:- start:630 stop:929 length:300 start_codon:yes stop_codon:yes gene_type:complete